MIATKVQRIHDAAVGLGATCRCGGKLERFNPNHYGPGPKGGQFAPNDGDGSNEGTVQVADSGQIATDAVVDHGAAEQVAQEAVPFDSGPSFDGAPEFGARIPWERIPGMSGKEGAKDTPSWARGLEPGSGDQTISDWVGRLLDEKYGPGNWKKGPTTEYNRIKKYGDRNFKKGDPGASTGYLIDDNEA